MERLTEEQKRMVEENIRLVYFVVDRYFKNNYNYIEKSELISEGMYALCQCMPYYNSEKGSISTFCCKCIKRHLVNYLNKYYNKKIATVSIDDYKETGSYYDKYDIDLTKELKEFLYKYLPEKTAGMAVDFYINNMDWEQVTKKHGCKDRLSACATVQQSLHRIGKNNYLKNKYIELFI